MASSKKSTASRTAMDTLTPEDHRQLSKFPPPGAPEFSIGDAVWVWVEEEFSRKYTGVIQDVCGYRQDKGYRYVVLYGECFTDDFFEGDIGRIVLMCPECDCAVNVKRTGNFWTCKNPHGPGRAHFSFDLGDC